MRYRQGLQAHTVRMPTYRRIHDHTSIVAITGAYKSIPVFLMRSPGRRSSFLVSFRPTTWDGVDANRFLGLRFDTSLTPSPELGISDGADIFKEFSTQPRTKEHDSAFWWPSAPLTGSHQMTGGVGPQLSGSNSCSPIEGARWSELTVVRPPGQAGDVD